MLVFNNKYKGKEDFLCMKIVSLLVVLLLLVPFVVAEDTCDAFCEEEGFSYGECREVTEAGFCEGDETVYGFDTCDNLDRCCCGDETVEEEVTGDVVEEVEEEEAECRTEIPVAETLFWFLLIAVILMAIAYYTTKKDKVEEIIEEL